MTSGLFRSDGKRPDGATLDRFRSDGKQPDGATLIPWTGGK